MAGGAEAGCCVARACVFLMRSRCARFSSRRRFASASFAAWRCSLSSFCFFLISASSSFESRPLFAALIRAFISAFSLRIRSASSAFFRAFSSAIFLRSSSIVLSSFDAVRDLTSFAACGFARRRPAASSTAALCTPLNSSNESTPSLFSSYFMNISVMNSMRFDFRFLSSPIASISTRISSESIVPLLSSSYSSNAFLRWRSRSSAMRMASW